MSLAHEMGSVLPMMNFVAMGIGCSLVPDCVRNLRSAGVVFKTIRGPNLVKKLGIIKRKQSGELAESFYRFAVQALGSRH